MPSVATRRRRALNISNRMEGGDVSQYPTAPTSHPTLSRPSTDSSLFSLLSLSFERPSQLSLLLLPLLLCAGYVYVHRAHLSLLSAAAMLLLEAVFVASFIAVFSARLQSKQSQWHCSRSPRVQC